VNTSSNPDSAASASDISERKKNHIDICVDGDKFSVEGNQGSGFNQLGFIHEALPEINYDNINTQTTFLDCALSLPLFISCMTGGSSRGLVVNKELAKAAQQARIPIGLGSIRVIFHKPDAFDDFYIKPNAPDVPVLANLGSVQVRDIPHDKIIELLKRLEVQALVVHLNPGQELAQPDGDRDFSGVLPALEKFINLCPIPVIVKETGFGIRPSRVRTLLGMGASYIDLAGSGGTNWMLVEGYRVPDDARSYSRRFSGWGLPTAMLLDVLGPCDGKILASGGLRDGVDLAKAVALGAHLGGMALPFIREVVADGAEAVIARVEKISHDLRSVMLLTGSPDLNSLTKAPLIKDQQFLFYTGQLKNAEGI